MFFSQIKMPERHILKGIVWIFIFATVMHFLYEICYYHPIIGWFAPINDSVWEHLKMVVLPTILWWGTYYLTHKEQFYINKDAWFSGTLGALLIMIALMVTLFHVYTKVLRFETVWADLIILVIAILIGQLVGLLIYHSQRGLSAHLAISLLFMIVLVFVVFTKRPLNIPIFQP